MNVHPASSRGSPHIHVPDWRPAQPLQPHVGSVRESDGRWA